jgi:lipoyl(octanoyl) transferase
MNICKVHPLGLIDYQVAWDLQNQYAAEIAADQRPPTLLLLEHPHTFTFGRRGQTANLLWDEAELARRGVAVHWVDRGGDVTYHGPGQLVGYPLIPLGRPHLPPTPQTPLPGGEGSRVPQANYVEYIRKLEQVIIAAVGEFGITAKRVEGLTGVWVDSDQFSVGNDQSSSIAKLAAIGVKVDARGITRHGFAINIDPDMAYWEGIIGCGLTYPEISLAQLLNPAPTLERLSEAVMQAFGQAFDYQLNIKGKRPNEKA